MVEMIIGWLATSGLTAMLPTAAGAAGGLGLLAALVKWAGYDLGEVRKAIAGFALPMAGLLATHWAQNGFGAWPDWGTMLQFAIVSFATAGGVFALPNRGKA